MFYFWWVYISTMAMGNRCPSRMSISHFDVITFMKQEHATLIHWPILIRDSKETIEPFTSHLETFQEWLELERKEERWDLVDIVQFRVERVSYFDGDGLLLFWYILTPFPSTKCQMSNSTTSLHVFNLYWFVKDEWNSKKRGKSS